jgi:hypothetical protein
LHSSSILKILAHRITCSSNSNISLAVSVLPKFVVWQDVCLSPSHCNAHTQTHILDAEPVARPGSPLRSPRGYVPRTLHRIAPTALCGRACVRKVQTADGALGWTALCRSRRGGRGARPTGGR